MSRKPDIRATAIRKYVHGEQCVVMCLSRDAAAYIRDLVGEGLYGGPDTAIFRTLTYDAHLPLRSGAEHGVMFPVAYDTKGWIPPEWDDTEEWER